MSIDISSCRERDSNPHSHHWPRDFKSLVSTNSTIAAWQKCMICVFSSAKILYYFDFTKLNPFFFMFLTYFWCDYAKYLEIIRILFCFYSDLL